MGKVSRKKRYPINSGRRRRVGQGGTENGDHGKGQTYAHKQHRFRRMARIAHGQRASARRVYLTEQRSHKPVCRPYILFIYLFYLFYCQSILLPDII